MIEELPQWLQPLARVATRIDDSDLSRFPVPDDDSGRASAVLIAPPWRSKTQRRLSGCTNHDCIGSWTVHWGSSSGATIWPSRIWMMRSPKLAASGLWVIIMTV